MDNDILRALAYGPKRHVRSWDHYYANGFNFHTHEYGKSKSTMNYGVCVKGTDGREYYGILLDVLELHYVGDIRPYKTILFKCDWFDCINGVVIHDTYKLVDVNHTKRYPKYDPFVLASQVTQVCYTPYPMKDNSKKDWWAVLKMKARSIIDAPEEDSPFQIDEHDDTPTLGDVDVDDDVEIVQEEENHTDDGVEEEDDAVDVDIVEEDENDTCDSVEEEVEDDDNVDEDDDYYLTESMFM